MAFEGGPADIAGRTYAEMATEGGLAMIATYADAVGTDLRMILHDNGAPTSLVADAHGKGLTVHGWTLRAENAFMPPALATNDNPRGLGGLPPLLGLLVAAGVDGVFTDNTLAAVTVQESGNYEP